MKREKQKRKGPRTYGTDWGERKKGRRRRKGGGEEEWDENEERDVDEEKRRRRSDLSQDSPRPTD